MSTMIQCDHCGRTKNGTNKFNTFYEIVFTPMNSFEPEPTYHLCYMCAREFKQFVNYENQPSCCLSSME